MVHRDIKPANIHVGRRGLQYDFVKVLDFGLVKSVTGEPTDQSLETAAGLMPGTPAFMAPEMALGEPYEYHAAGCISAEGVLKGLNIPHVIIDDPARIRSTVEQALVTVKGQKSIVGLLFASHVLDGEIA